MMVYANPPLVILSPALPQFSVKRLMFRSFSLLFSAVRGVQSGAIDDGRLTTNSC
jgi:hypothetical protein